MQNNIFFLLFFGVQRSKGHSGTSKSRGIVLRLGSIKNMLQFSKKKNYIKNYKIKF